MARRRTGSAANQGPPIQFRPPAELAQFLHEFPARTPSERNEVCKRGVVMFFAGLDVRYYSVVLSMAELTAGANAFVRCCVQLHAVVQAAAGVGGDENARRDLIHRTARSYVEGRGGRWAHDPPRPEPREATARPVAPRRRLNEKLMDDG